MEIHVRRLKRYCKLSEAEIESRVEKILKEEKLPNQYFTNGVYKNRRMRSWDRLKLMGKNHRILELIRSFLGLGLCIPLVFVIFMFTIAYIITKDVIIKQNLLILINYTILFFIPYLLWIWIWTRPTKFEIQNDYVDD